jgi:tetratricopeptide (TPR) repeat protein
MFSSVDFGTARMFYREAIKRDPNFVAALVGQAKLMRDATLQAWCNDEHLPGVYARAVAMAEHALRLAPNNSAALKLRIGLLLDNQSHDQAMQMAQNAIRDKPNDPMLQQALATAYLATGDRKNAHLAAVKALSITPTTDWEQLLHLAELFSLLEDHDKAILLAEKSLDLGGTSHRIAYILAPSYAGVGRLDDAATQIETINYRRFRATTKDLRLKLAYIQDKDVVDNYLKSFQLAGMK